MQYPYSEVKNFNQNELMKNNPFLEIIQRKININTLHDLIYKEMLITSILEQRFQAKLIIKKFLKSKINLSLTNKLKNIISSIKLFINNINQMEILFKIDKHDEKVNSFLFFYYLCFVFIINFVNCS